MFYVYAAYLFLINTTGFILMWRDKRAARHGDKRIPERLLFTVAWLFGALGSCLGMYIFHHKTRHLRFSVGLPMLFLVQVYVILLLIGKKIIRLP